MSKVRGCTGIVENGHARPMCAWCKRLTTHLLGIGKNPLRPTVDAGAVVTCFSRLPITGNRAA